MVWQIFLFFPLIQPSIHIHNTHICWICLVLFMRVVCVWSDRWSDELYWVALQNKNATFDVLAVFPVFISHSSCCETTFTTHISAGKIDLFGICLWLTRRVHLVCQKTCIGWRCKLKNGASDGLPIFSCSYLPLIRLSVDWTVVKRLLWDGAAN